MFQSIQSALWREFFFIALACFALSPPARAVSPPPGGGYQIANTALGENALFSLTSGQNNTAIGFRALYFDTTGPNNTAVGQDALRFTTTGGQNTANGANALSNNTTGSNNTASGFFALTINTTGNNNTANGFSALFTNSTGSNNTADGVSALNTNTTGDANTAIGANALYKNTTGSNNMANGINALYKNTTGDFNMANGGGALKNNTTGLYNSATGINALGFNTTGNFNIALGLSAGVNLTTGSNNIDIGNRGVAGESSRIRIGTKGTHTNTFIAGISGVAVPGGVGVIVDTNGKLGTVVSSKRFKQEIKPMDKASEAILSLEPVTFRYKRELDPDDIPQFGLVAEQVEKVNPDLVARDENGKAYTVRYEAVNAMLLNEFLKEHRKVEELEATVAKLQSAFKEQASQIQRVSEQLQLRKSALQIVASNE
jgi:hypothetical protein